MVSSRSRFAQRIRDRSARCRAARRSMKFSSAGRFLRLLGDLCRRNRASGFPAPAVRPRSCGSGPMARASMAAFITSIFSPVSPSAFANSRLARLRRAISRALRRLSRAAQHGGMDLVADRRNSVRQSPQSARPPGRSCSAPRQAWPRTWHRWPRSGHWSWDGLRRTHVPSWGGGRFEFVNQAKPGGGLKAVADHEFQRHRRDELVAVNMLGERHFDIAIELPARQRHFHARAKSAGG